MTRRTYSGREGKLKERVLVLAACPPQFVHRPFTLNLLGPTFSFLPYLSPADWHPGWVSITAPGQWGGARGPSSARGRSRQGDRAEVRLWRRDPGTVSSCPFIPSFPLCASSTEPRFLTLPFLLPQITVLSAMTEEAAVAIKAMAK